MKIFRNCFDLHFSNLRVYRVSSKALRIFHACKNNAWNNEKGVLWRAKPFIELDLYVIRSGKSSLHMPYLPYAPSCVPCLAVDGTCNNLI